MSKGWSPAQTLGLLSSSLVLFAPLHHRRLYSCSLLINQSLPRVPVLSHSQDRQPPSQSGTWNSYCPRAVTFKYFQIQNKDLGYGPRKRAGGGALGLHLCTFESIWFYTEFLCKVSSCWGRAPTLSPKIGSGVERGRDR